MQKISGKSKTSQLGRLEVFLLIALLVVWFGNLFMAVSVHRYRKVKVDPTIHHDYNLPPDTNYVQWIRNMQRT